MDIVCSNCRARLKIPDEKVPTTGRVTANCPKCGSKIFLEKSQSSPASPPIRKLAEMDVEFPARDEDPFSLEYHEEGAKLALLMLTEAEANNHVREATEGLRHKTVLVKNIGEGISKMRFHLFNLLILSEGFDELPWAQSPVLHYLNRLPMHTRRKSFLVLLGSEFITMDRMTAFGLSANLVVNPKDLNQFPDILNAALVNQKNFYRAFAETLREIGKG